MVPAWHCNCMKASIMKPLLRVLLLMALSWSVNSKISDCAYEEESEIDTSLNGLAQNDPILVDALKNYYLSGPVDELPYNIEKYRLDPTLLAGQFKQAQIIDLFYNRSKTNGFFFEAGAYDGVAVSNSLFFELKRGWTGLLVEAHPDNYERLLDKNRKVWSLGNCISMSAEPEIVVFDAATIFGGIIQEGRPKPGDSIPSHQREEMREITERTRRSIKMQCFPLYSMLLAVGNPTVDYMSLDIEGAEEGVLRTIPWNKVDIKIIGLEIIVEKSDESAEGQHFNSFPNIYQMLTDQEYVLVRTDWHTREKKSVEAYFVQKDLADKINKKYWKPMPEELLL